MTKHSASRSRRRRSSARPPDDLDTLSFRITLAGSGSDLLNNEHVKVAYLGL